MTIDENSFFGAAFVYGPIHNVVEVVKTDYDGCLTNASLSTNTGGKTVISLSSIGARYFICGAPGHCDRGMKVVITTIAAPPPPPGTVPSAPPPADAPSSSTPTSPPPATSPTVSPVSTPVSAPAPKTESPANSPKTSPSKSPSKAPVSSPSKSPSKSPAFSPQAQGPAAKSPDTPPSDSTPPSSANKITAGVGFIIMMLLAL